MSEVKLIRIAEDFSDAPGARYRSDGPASGQEFFEEMLKPAFEKASQEGVLLVIDMDGAYGYATSFISEAFGSLSKEFGPQDVLARIEIISTEDELLKKFIIETITKNDKEV